MNCIIMGNGKVDDLGYCRQFISEEDYIICCDGGISHLKALDIIPSVIIGDLDSASIADLEYFTSKNVPIMKYNTKKDETDMEISINEALKMNPQEILIFGAIGTRFDHSMANAHILKKALDKGIKACLINEHNKVYMTDKKFQIFGNKGDIISLLPFTEKVTGVTTKNLEYPLNNATMYYGSAWGLSNVMQDSYAEIDLKNGILFVIYARD